MMPQLLSSQMPRAALFLAGKVFRRYRQAAGATVYCQTSSLVHTLLWRVWSCSLATCVAIDTTSLLWN